MTVPGPVSLPHLAEGLRARIPGVTELVSCTRLSGGASQETYRVVTGGPAGERRFAMRRSLGGVAQSVMPGHPGLRVEARLMTVARAAGVPEPEVLWVFDPEDGLGEGFVMEWLDGETLGKRIVAADELAEVRPRLAYQCGEILARVHAIDVDADFGSALARLTPEAFLDQTYARYRSFDAPQPMIDYTARWLRERLEGMPPPERLALVHNDFRNGNLMVGAKGVVAVLDWELAHVGDPMRDLGWICTNSWRFGRSDLPVGGFGAYEDLFAGYESVSGSPVDRERVHYWEVFGSFWWAVGCLEMANAFRTGIDRSIERAAIGRRSSECQIDCVNLIIPGPVHQLEPTTAHSSSDMPRAAELLEAASRYLREEVMTTTAGRTAFLARVTANALDIVARENTLGPAHREIERRQLAALLARDGEADELRRELADGLRSGAMPLDRPGLADYLRDSVVRQVAIDQPGYGGLRSALHRSGHSATPAKVPSSASPKQRR